MFADLTTGVFASLGIIVSITILKKYVRRKHAEVLSVRKDILECVTFIVTSETANSENGVDISMKVLTMIKYSLTQILKSSTSLKMK